MWFYALFYAAKRYVSHRAYIPKRYVRCEAYAQFYATNKKDYKPHLPLRAVDNNTFIRTLTVSQRFK